MEQLELKQVDIGYGGQPLIRNIDLSFLQGKMTCILGSNGAGKTTLLKTIARIIKPIGGAISLSGENVSRMNGSRYAKEVSAERWTETKGANRPRTLSKHSGAAVG